MMLSPEVEEGLRRLAEQKHVTVEQLLAEWIAAAGENATSSEARYRAVIESQIDLICRYTPDTTLTFVNDAYCRFVGKAREELIGHSFMVFVPEERHAPIYERIATLLQDPRPEVAVNMTIGAGGEQRWIQWVDHGIVNEHGEVVEIQAVGRDVTALKRAEEALHLANQRQQALNAELEARNAEMERFAYTVSHDLKSPLITIRGFLTMLEDDISAGQWEDVRKDMAFMHNAAVKMQTLLDDLLELSRVGRLVNPPEAVPLKPLLEEVVSLLHAPITQRGVAVTLPDAPAVVHGDRTRLREVFQNLIENAVKFMGSQPEPRIDIGVLVDSDPAITVFVHDNGIGIDPRHHERIFGLFERLQAGTDGTGIGLALVKRIVEVHGGRVWVQSEGQGRGSTFYVRLPV